MLDGPQSGGGDCVWLFPQLSCPSPAQVVQSQGIQPQVIYPQVMQPQGGMPVPAQPACPPQGKVTIIQKIIQTIKIEF